ncbi:cytochrome c oxidase subunit 3 [Halorientalis marina]|uniref:cytochrome c oxidase subunit 3 n=1 Tax=Halorientalis marina TaxID=2931976 RepID=UPI001FF1A863|nr:heme-copper oxidase subunit III [Halorientalis marina]
MSGSTVDERRGRGGNGHGDGGDHEEHRSRWPFVAAIGTGALYFGAALTFLAASAGVLPSVVGLSLVGLGAVGIVAGLAGWVYEGFLAGYWDHRVSPARQRAYRTTTILFLLTDVATFGAGFVYYFFVRAGAWPPSDLPHLLGSLVLVNTGLLVASSVTLHFAHTSLEAGKRRRFLGLLGATLALGVTFVGGQLLEYYEFVVEGGFTLTSGVFWSGFYGLTGLHGFHVLVGVVFIGVVFARALRGQYDAERDTSVATASLYWHFVDAVWLFLVAVLYVGATV